VRAFTGGMAEWTEAGGRIEMGDERAKEPAAAGAVAPAGRGTMARVARSGNFAVGLLDALAARSVGQLLLAWLGMALGFGVLYWIAGLGGLGGLMEAGTPEPMTLRGLLSAIYFSFITAMSVGYGDVLPTGPMRVLAIVEAIAGLLIFGFVISKFVSRRQEQVIDEIHRIAFEDRLGRVQTGLHLALSEMQAIALRCGDGGAPPPRTLARAESAAMVFARELRTVHDLLYRPKSELEEETVEAILVTLTAAFRELHDLVACLAGGADRAGAPRSAALDRSLHAIGRLGGEICGECVPRAFAPGLKDWMDQIQDLARRLPGPAPVGG
jgi:Ion channel